MNKEFRLPDVGEGLTEADIVSWKVKPGDTVKVNQVIVDIETAKAVVELPSPWDGVVSELLVPEGQTVDVGVPIISIDVAGGGEPGQAEEAGQAEVPASEAADIPNGSSATPKRQPVLVGYGVKPGSTSRRPRKKGPTHPASYPGTPSVPPAVAPPA
ncbi:MAG: 2-oxo acid dehydrogenase subunit E2, partial [Acidimicrobiaceae bacterium]|nr:2-oxo acid dehydrogenase subunit E2 [Acidimicrobiaceae bacterium]